MSKALHRAADHIDETLFTFARYDEEAAERTGYSDYSYWRSTWRVFLKNRMAVALLILLGTLLAFTFIQPYLPNQKPPTMIHFHPDTALLCVVPGDEIVWHQRHRPGPLVPLSGTRTLFIGFVMASPRR